MASDRNDQHHTQYQLPKRVSVLGGTVLGIVTDGKVFGRCFESLTPKGVTRVFFRPDGERQEFLTFSGVGESSLQIACDCGLRLLRSLSGLPTDVVVRVIDMTVQGEGGKNFLHLPLCDGEHRVSGKAIWPSDIPLELALLAALLNGGACWLNLYSQRTNPLALK